MQTRFMQRSNSMAREKRTLDHDDSSEEGQPDRKRPALARWISRISYSYICKWRMDILVHVHYVSINGISLQPLLLVWEVKLDLVMSYPCAYELGTTLRCNALTYFLVSFEEKWDSGGCFWDLMFLSKSLGSITVTGIGWSVENISMLVHVFVFRGWG